MADISGRVYEKVYQDFVKTVGSVRMRAAESARAVGQEQRLSTQVVESTKQFQQQEKRQYQTDIARILAQLYGSQMGYMSAGLRAQYSPETYMETYRRIADEKGKTSQEINDIFKSPLANERFGIEVMGLNKEIENYDFRDKNTYDAFINKIELMGRKYEISPTGSKEKIVLEDSKLGGYGIVKRDVRLWSTIAGDAPQLKRVRGILGLQGEQSIDLNDDVGLLKRKATIKDVFGKLLNSDVIQGTPDLMAQAAGYENATALINNFANEWCDDDVAKARTVETMQAILKANGLEFLEGGVIRPDEANVAEKLVQRMKLSAMQTGIQVYIPNFYIPPEKTLDKETVDSLSKKVDARKQKSKTPPTEYTLSMVDSLVSDKLPTFANEATKSKVQKAFLDSIDGKIQRILNGEVKESTATKELMEYLQPKMQEDDYVITAYPFITKSQYRRLYQMIVEKTNGKAKLANDAEKDLNLK